MNRAQRAQSAQRAQRGVNRDGTVRAKRDASTYSRQRPKSIAHGLRVAGVQCMHAGRQAGLA